VKTLAVIVVIGATVMMGGSVDQEGRQGNIKQNTHNQGYQQDR
jgi:hypothetical protein